MKDAYIAFDSMKARNVALYATWASFSTNASGVGS